MPNFYEIARIKKRYQFYSFRFAFKLKIMATSVADKLKIKGNYSLLTLNAPSDFKKGLQGLPPGVKVTESAKEYNQVHWFIKNKAQLEKEMSKVMKLVKDDVIVWVYYPKGTSGVQTDLTRDKGWDKFLAHEEMHWLSLISFDETWSAFACRLKKESDHKKEKKTSERPINDFIDPVNKTVRVPEDLQKALKKNKKLETLFNSFAYSHRKEYVEWIVSAKKEETRASRIQGTLDRLEKGWKNPTNR